MLKELENTHFRPERRKRQWFFRFILVGIGGLVSLVFAEVVLRMVKPTRVHKVDPVTGWCLIPGKAGWKYENCEGNRRKLRFKISSQGLHDKEVSKKGQGVFRVLLLGDSFSEALGVPAGCAYHCIAEQGFRGPRQERRLEIVNCGVCGFSIDQELLFFKSRAVEFEPDAVCLVIFLGNDFRELVAAQWGVQPYYILDEQNQLELRNFPYREPWFKTFLRKFEISYQVKRFLRTHLGLWPGRRAGFVAGEGRAVHEERHHWRSSWPLAQALVREFQLEVMKQNLDFFVVIIPADFQIHRSASTATEAEFLDEAEEKLSILLDELNVPILRLSVPLKKASISGSEPLYYRSHWTRRGHAVAGEALAQFVSRYLRKEE